MKLLKIFMSIFLVTQLVGCFNQNSNPVSSTELTSNPKENTQLGTTSTEIISYDTYKLIVNDFKLDFKIPEFSLKVPPYENLNIVDKDLTFDTRENITLDGERDLANLQPTSYIIIFENSNSSKQIIIRLSYNKNFIGNDLIDWSNLEYEQINKKLAKQIDLATLSYKNLLITIQQISSEQSDRDLTKSIIRETVKKMKKY